LKEKEIIVSSLILNPEEFHCSKIYLVINSELLLLFTKKGCDKFNVSEINIKSINKFNNEN